MIDGGDPRGLHMQLPELHDGGFVKVVRGPTGLTELAVQVGNQTLTVALRANEVAMLRDFLPDKPTLIATQPAPLDLVVSASPEHIFAAATIDGERVTAILGPTAIARLRQWAESKLAP